MTNLELVTVLRRLQGANILDGPFFIYFQSFSPKKLYLKVKVFEKFIFQLQIKRKIEYDLQIKSILFLNKFLSALFLSGPEEIYDVKPWRYPEKLPHGMDRYKSSTHVALSRDAVYFIINGDLSKKLQQALKPFNFAEESFFAILQYNPSSSMPGGLIIDGNDNRIKRQKSMRYKFWIHSKEELERCYSRRIVRDICCIGVKTLPELVGSFYGKILFLNKFPWFFEPMAWDCMNLWHHSKVSLELSTKSVPANFSNLGNGSQVIWSRKSKSSAR